jgi:polysaccharide export outer membrane protein
LPGDYVIGPGDVLEVGIFALEAADKTALLKRTVSQEGAITLPWVGSVLAAGLSVRQLEEAAKTAYGGKYLKDPQVTVTVTEYRSAAVVVTGAVEKPGVYYLNTRGSSVLSLLAEAGGLTEKAGDEILVIRSGNSPRVLASSEGGPEDSPESKTVELVPAATGPEAQAAGQSGNGRKVVAIDLKQLVDEGNLLLNLPVGSGDIVTVPPRTERYVYVLGYVQRPGAYEIKDGMRVDALRAVALAGGLSPSARAENSVLVRETAQRQQVVAVDLTKMARGVRPPLYMQPGDTLVVGSSMAGRMSEFLRPTVGAGVNLSPGGR